MSLSMCLYKRCLAWFSFASSSGPGCLNPKITQPQQLHPRKTVTDHRKKITARPVPTLALPIGGAFSQWSYQYADEGSVFLKSHMHPYSLCSLVRTGWGAIFIFRGHPRDCILQVERAHGVALILTLDRTEGNVFFLSTLRLTHSQQEW